jgi:hypothetical protein
MIFYTAPTTLAVPPSVGETGAVLGTEHRRLELTGYGRRSAPAPVVGYFFAGFFFAFAFFFAAISFLL